ncbi:MAG: phosphoribosyltransferase [Pseudonocardiaceae bacterium]
MFANRVDAGQQLGRRSEHLKGPDVVVLGLPRGGVPVAAEVAEALDAPLDVILVRKLGVPDQPELAMGALGEDEVQVLVPQTIRRAGVTEQELAAVHERERAELRRRSRRFRADRERLSLTGKTALLVDDGIATGSTARAACQVASALGATHVVVAVPVAPAGWTQQFADCTDELICLVTPRHLVAIGRWYADFSQTTDDEVLSCLERARTGSASAEGRRR